MTVTTYTGFGGNNQRYGRTNTNMVVDSGWVGMNYGYYPIPFGIDGWDPNGIFRAAGWSIYKVECWINMTLVRFMVQAHNTTTGTVTCYLGENPYNASPELQGGLRILQSSDYTQPSIAIGYHGIGSHVYTITAGDGGSIDYQPPDGVIAIHSGVSEHPVLGMSSTDPAILTLFDQDTAAQLYYQRVPVFTCTFAPTNPGPDVHFWESVDGEFMFRYFASKP